MRPEHTSFDKISLAVAVVLLTTAAKGPASVPSTPLQQYEIVLEKNITVRMRDGLVLRADVYRPDAPGTFPALLQRTPYSKNGSGADARFRRLAARGYVVVLQDTRGRYMSEGIARPHEEAEDGYDTVEWVASFPFVNDKVGMFGGSYLATTQLMAASLAPPHLVALFPSSSYASRYDMVFQGGAFYLSDGLGWNLGQAADVRRRMLTPNADRDGPIGLTREQRRMLRERWLWHVPLKTMNELDLRRFAPGYFWMLEHPGFDEFWETFDIAARHDRFEVPALHLTGWFDTLLTGTLANFAGLRANARTENARAGQRLIVGPWTHAGPTPESTTIGDVDFGPDAGLDSRGSMNRWFDYWLRGEELSSGAAGEEIGAAGEQSDPGYIWTPEAPPVRIFVMGENVWRYENEWPLARARDVAYYLHSSGNANTLNGDGELSIAPPGREPPDRFVYDPSNPVSTGSMGGYSRAPADQREVEQREDVLVYTSEPLADPVEVTGPVSLVLWVASSARDTDVTAKLVDVLPDGTARALTDSILRARYRNSKSAPELLEPGEPVELTIDLLATSNLFKEGHRIRLEVSSSNFPRFDRNPNTGGVFGEDAELLTAEQAVFHDLARPSRLILPVVPR